MAKWRILIVDDEEDVRMIVRTTISSKYEVVEAKDGLDALEKVERYQPDFVVMDVMMPLMNGFEACQAIRKNPNYREIPVLFLSALGSKEDMKKGYASGANLYLTKPFDPPRLLKNIDVFFERTPPEKKSKRYTIEEIETFEREGRVPVTPGGREYDLGKADTQRDFPEPEPATPRKAPAPSAPAPPPVDPSVLPRVMAVDDDREMCRLIRMTCKDVYEVVFAHDGMEAIELLIRYQPDLLILDIMLPKMNGFQLCQSLRSNRAFKHMPILMCSAKGAEKDINLAKRIGANDYLVKPFGATELLRKLEEMRQLPGFRVRPKTYSMAQILEIEEAGASDQDVFQGDDEAKKQSDQGRKELKNFLAKEGDKEALDRSKTADEPKKKRRLFGFGGREES